MAVTLLKFNMMGKALSGELSCMWTGLVFLFALNGGKEMVFRCPNNKAQYTYTDKVMECDGLSSV